MLTKEDCANLIKIMNRVKFDGIAEASVAVDLARKLKAILDGEDVSTADQQRSE